MKTQIEGTKIHRFELAGLGRAPFRYVGSYVSKFQAVPGDPSCPIQPGTSCDYCGQGIMYVCRVQDANGHEFKVGNECVRRTGDKHMIKLVSEVERQTRLAASQSRAAGVRADLTMMLADAPTRAKLASKPHPQAWAAAQGRTLLDWAEWMAEQAGATGRAKVLKVIRGL
jgi:hypothetical protein